MFSVLGDHRLRVHKTLLFPRVCSWSLFVRGQLRRVATHGQIQYVYRWFDEATPALFTRNDLLIEVPYFFPPHCVEQNKLPGRHSRDCGLLMLCPTSSRK